MPTTAVKPTMRREVITPATAERYLTKNVDNRPLRRQTVTRYARDMKAGRWELTGDPIVFNTHGNLVQGQHRLYACVESATEFETFVMRNASPAAYTVMDTGEKRSLADVLHRQGEIQTMQLAAAIHLSWRWDNGSLRDSRLPSRFEAIEWLEANPEIRSGVSGIPVRVYDFLSRAQAATLFYRFNQVDPEACALFFEKLGSGTDLHEGHPVHTLRKWFFARQKEARTIGAHTGGQGRLPTLAVVVKAWNAFITGSDVQQLRWRGAVEPFPPVRNADGSEYPFPEVLSGKVMTKVPSRRGKAGKGRAAKRK